MSWEHWLRAGRRDPEEIGLQSLNFSICRVSSKLKFARHKILNTYLWKARSLSWHWLHWAKQSESDWELPEKMDGDSGGREGRCLFRYLSKLFQWGNETSPMVRCWRQFGEPNDLGDHDFMSVAVLWRGAVAWFCEGSSCLMVVRCTKFASVERFHTVFSLSTNSGCKRPSWPCRLMSQTSAAHSTAAHSPLSAHCSNCLVFILGELWSSVTNLQMPPQCGSREGPSLLASPAKFKWSPPSLPVHTSQKSWCASLEFAWGFCLLGPKPQSQPFVYTI